MITEDTKAFDAEAFADQVDAEAKAWIIERYKSASLYFNDKSMVTAYRAGYAAGLRCARKIQAEATP